MKSVVCIEPDECELVLSNRDKDSFILDPATYDYFRDKVFIERIQAYISKKHPRKLPEGRTLQSGGWSETCRTAEVIAKYYSKWKNQESRFYEYNGSVYSFIFHGFFNVGNEIELIQWNPKEITEHLNEPYRKPIRWAFKNVGN